MSPQLKNKTPKDQHEKNGFHFFLLAWLAPFSVTVGKRPALRGCMAVLGINAQFSSPSPHHPLVSQTWQIELH